MLLAYLDESSSDGHFYIGAMIIHESNARALTSALDGIMNDAAARFPGRVSADMELHAHELVNAKKRWKSMETMLRARIGIFEGAIRAVVASDARMIFEGIHLQRFAERGYRAPEEPHKLALMWMCERVNEFAKSHEALALIIADEVDHRDEHRRNLWVAQRYGTRGYKAQQIDHIVDTLHFAPSDTTRLLQAADVATYLYRRRIAHVETDPRSEREWERLYQILLPSIHRGRCWPPP